MVMIGMISLKAVDHTNHNHLRSILLNVVFPMASAPIRRGY